jgi:hypothetical protein
VGGEGGGGVGGEGGGRQGGEMTQALHAHMNNKKIKIKKKTTGCLYAHLREDWTS